MRSHVLAIIRHLLAGGAGTRREADAKWQHVKLRLLTYLGDFERRDSLPPRLDKLVVFVGWGRSGHSYIGQVLNAHKDILIGNEGALFEYFARHPTKIDVFNYIAYLDYVYSRKGYRKVYKRKEAVRPGIKQNPQNMFIEGGYQGYYDEELKVLGNSKAAATTHTLYEDRGALDRLAEVTGLEPRVIFVSRHPRDIVASKVKRRGREAKEVLNTFGRRCKKVEEVVSFVSQNYKFCDVQYENFIGDTRYEVRRLYSFLGVDAPDSLVEAIARRTYSSPDLSYQKFPELQTEEAYNRYSELAKQFDVFSAYR